MGSVVDGRDEVDVREDAIWNQMERDRKGASGSDTFI
jgi:hypothetical protein